jgi:hypothetical protein
MSFHPKNSLSQEKYSLKAAGGGAPAGAYFTEKRS